MWYEFEHPALLHWIKKHLEEWWDVNEAPVRVECVLVDEDERKGVLELRDQATKALPAEVPMMEMKLYTKKELDDCPPCTECGELRRDNRVVRLTTGRTWSPPEDTDVFCSTCFHLGELCPRHVEAAVLNLRDALP